MPTPITREPKRKVIYPGAGHGLQECADDVRDLLRGWLVEELGVSDTASRPY